MIRKEKLSQVWGHGAGLGEGEYDPAGQVPHGFHRRDASRLLTDINICCKEKVKGMKLSPLQ